VEHIVFVYGTLRQGGVRAIPQLFPPAEFLGLATVVGWLYDFGAYPGLIVDAAGRDIVGEVYRVDEAAVREMDEIERYVEGHDAECFYFRRERAVTLRAGGEVTAWLYECNPNYYDCTTPIPADDWIAFANAKGELPEEAWPDGAPIKK
jgi:gamma-glutamylcyclotransferase (GGCT)/AIG2-like uncharacterized protein YtfP